MWYYELNQQPFGPVSKETIADELKAGRITPQTRVWREGWAEWRHLGETELAVLAGVTPPPAISAAAIPVYASIPQNKKVNLSTLTKLFWWWLGLLSFSVPFYLLNVTFAKENWSVAFSCIYEIPLLASTVLWYILIYKFWQVVQDDFVLTSPGKAVGFMFIPVFNFYWNFVALFGLAKNQNKYISRNYEAKGNNNLHKSHPVISLIYVILILLSAIVSGYLMVNMFIAAFSSPNDPTAMSNYLSSYIWPLAAFYMVYIAIRIWMFFDLYLSTKSILKAEENQPQ